MSATLGEILNSHRTHKPVVMGVLNVTPDSFSDGGRFLDAGAAIAQSGQMAADGADIIDVGAESTRPGSQRVGADEQIRRIKPVLPEVTKLDAIVSIDTTSSAVAGFALDAGARIINDVSAGRDDSEMFPLAASRGAVLILMHMLGDPKSMQENPQYDDVVKEVRDFLAGRIEAAVDAGVERNRLIVDPGIGFGKNLEHNLALLGHIKVLVELGAAVLVGPSRKRFIGEISGQSDPSGRVGGTIAAVLAAFRGGATIFRVHDVAATVQALAVARAIGKREHRRTDDG
ncbi:MAG: dihydropteroate synthase [Planctomycetota bacterium]|nr:dihydropteroate synthase [Planctomycetota bacterium]